MKKIEIIEDGKRTSYVSVESLMDYLNGEYEACRSLLDDCEFDSSKYHRWIGHLAELRDIMVSL